MLGYDNHLSFSIRFLLMGLVYISGKKLISNVTKSWSLMP